MSLYRIKHEGFVTFVEASCLSRAEEAWLADVRSEPDNADFNEEPDSIELLSIEPVVRDGATACPTPSGASADTGANGAGSSTGSLQVGQTTNAPSSGSSTASAPPPAEKPDPMKYVRMTRSAVERTRDNGLNPNWWCAAAIRLCDAHEALLAAYDAERAKLVEAERRLSEAYSTVTDCREAVNIRREDQFNAHAKVRELQGRLAKIAAILSDDSLENPQKIGRALRVAEGNA